MLVGRGSEPRFCSFVFSHELFKLSGAAAVLKLDKQDAASPVDGSNSAVSSAYTRSFIFELLMLIPGRTDMCSMIQSTKQCGARMHPFIICTMLYAIAMGQIKTDCEILCGSSLEDKYRGLRNF